MSMIFIVPRRSAFLSCEKNRLWDSTRETRFGRIFQSNWIPEQPEPKSTDWATKSNADDLVEESTSAGCGPVGARPTTQPTSSEPHPAADRVAAAVVQFQAALGKIKQWGQRTDCTSSASPSPWPCAARLSASSPIWIRISLYFELPLLELEALYNSGTTYQVPGNPFHARKNVPVYAYAS